ncbi:MAG: malonic semialdehyde reductase [Gammaproteobacteria bacterium]|nr:MAG: malonic semialdehyde reductase [Gammaproteobacteria bacterium]
MKPIDQQSIQQLFTDARTHSYWQDRGIAADTLRQLYQLAAMGPTSMNAQPGRFVFITTPAAKQRLLPALAEGNRDKTMAAPATVIVAHDPAFYRRMPELFPHMEGAEQLFANNEELAQSTAFRNGTLQGAWLIMAARALGLDCGPMSGFDNAKADEIFFAESGWKSNFLINLGYGDPEKLHPRGKRLDFEESCLLL